MPVAGSTGAHSCSNRPMSRSGTGVTQPRTAGETSKTSPPPKPTSRPLVAPVRPNIGWPGCISGVSDAVFVRMSIAVNALRVAISIEWTGAPFVHTAFTGVTGPRVPEALEVFARLGHGRLSVAFWFLCAGLLVARARAEIAAFSARTGIDVVDAGYLGPDPRLVPVVTARYHESLQGAPSVNCDLCSYRAPWPGLDGRVGQPVGVGHSHLAADHRHRGGNGAR